jgi:DeoR/GlpR family transcriptional regulator of sugar metabolism
MDAASPLASVEGGWNLDSFKRLARMEKIAEIVREKGSTSIEEIADSLQISASSVRRDLNTMGKMEKYSFKRYPGGIAVGAQPAEPGYMYERRLQAEYDLKLSIAEKAQELVSDGDAVMVFSGTTCFLAAQKLAEKAQKLPAKKWLHILTADLKIAEEMAKHDNLEVFALGGKIDHSLIIHGGGPALAFINEININKLLISSDAIDIERGIADQSHYSVSLKRKSIEIAHQVIFLADYKKFGKPAMHRIADITALDVIVTNKELDPGLARRIEQKGIRLVLA